MHAGRSGDLASHLRIMNVPAILGVINERITQFKGPVSIQSLREFARYLFPANVLTKVGEFFFHTSYPEKTLQKLAHAIYRDIFSSKK